MAYNGYKSDRVPQKIPQIVQDKKFPNMFRVNFAEGGVVHKSLSEMYSSRAEAQKAIDYWVIGYTRNKILPKAPKNDIPRRLAQKEKVEKNGEEESTS